jgi:preprotein translocase subunit SecD
VLALIVLLVSLAYCLPSFYSADSILGKILPDKKINLGLDLKGGIHLTLGVEVEKAIANSLSQAGEDIRATARENGFVVLQPRVVDNEKLQFVVLKEEHADRVEELLADQYQNLKVDEVQKVEGERQKYLLSYTPDYRKRLVDMTIDQALKTIRNRVDQFGVAEPDIRKQKNNRIQVQLPGLDDPERAIKLVGRTAHLEFKIVDSDADVQKAVDGVLPPGSGLYYIYKTQPDGSTSKTPIVLKENSVLTGEYVTDAKTMFDTYNRPYVSITFNRQGARIFERVTKNNVNKRLAIVLDGKVYSAPVIQERISGGRASITGQFTTQEAHDLAIVLRAGSLPAPVDVLEERSIGPSLGQQSIEQGVLSALIGGALVLLFMVIYFGFAGVVADLVLGFNILLIMAGLAGFGATLTLPGIAGIILTIGIAVDANVLIFERVREELRRGLSPRKAVDEGFSRATLTILDANVTTIIAAIILYQFGTGPIRGFAVTLSLGILASFFTAIFVSRIVFDLWLQTRQPASSLNI